MYDRINSSIFPCVSKDIFQSGFNSGVFRGGVLRVHSTPAS